MRVTKLRVVVGAILLLEVAAWAQEFPRAQVGFDYSYLRYSPSQFGVQGHSLDGGGGSLTFNFNQYLGIAMDLQGYNSTQAGFILPRSVNFPRGITGNVQGNLFTYLFGPQVTIRSPKVHPFFHGLFGGAHSNLYGNAFSSFCRGVAGACSFSTTPANNAFAMAIGGGIDIPIGKTVLIRPAGVDYLLTRFSNPFEGKQNQNNFRYTAGVFFNLGHHAHY
jgi:hypothetical protein